MAQQLNLYDDRLRPRVVRPSAVQTAAATGLVLLAAFTASQALAGRAGAAAERAAALEQQVAAAAAGAATPSSATAASAAGAVAGAGALPASRLTDLAAEIERLRRFDAAQRRVRGLLEVDATRRGGGYADTFDALARQARAALWITGLTVSADGDAIDLEGRMLDAGALPEYLRRLNDEPRFKGRPFARLSLNAMDTPADATGPPFLEFALRSTAATAP